MAENGSFQPQRSDNPRTPEDDEDGGEEEEDQCLDELQGLSEPQLGSELGSCGAAPREAQSETLAVGESDQCSGLQVNSSMEERGGEEFKEQVGVSSQEVLASITVQALEGQIQNQLQSATCPMSPLELQPTTVAQPISSAPSPTLIEQKALSLKENICSPDMERQNPSKLNPISTIAVVKTPTSDGFNWRKYGQKLVKSPEGSRSYYKCTFSECCAKRVESCDHSGRVVEMVYKGQHNHDPPQKSSCTRGKRLSSTQRILCNSIVEQPTRMVNESSPSISSKEPVEDASSAPERKRLNSSNSDENDGILVKEESVNEPEPKRRVKNGKLAYSGPPFKPGKKPKFVVHAACDVGISADGYRWRKYGQKMVKGNPHPRNYYRCTSAGCPVRKHIETTVDNTSAMIITYKGIHDHDMPVPKKRHGPPSAPLVAAMNNAQSKKDETVQGQISSTQWSVGKEGELTGEALDLGGEKAMESARTLLSIGFEIKPC